MKRVQTPTDTERSRAAQLFAQHQKLAFYAVNRWFPLLPACDKDDAKSVAMFGLWKACLTYDPTRGFRFSSYATVCMMNQFRIDGLWRGEQRRQGTDYNAADAPRLLHLNAGIGDGTDTLGDLLAGSDCDPLAVLLLREEINDKVDQARDRWTRIPRSVKIRHSAEVRDAAAELFGPEHAFVPTDEELATRRAYLEVDRERKRIKKHGGILPERRRSGPKPKFAEA